MAENEIRQQQNPPGGARQQVKEGPHNGGGQEPRDDGGGVLAEAKPDALGLLVIRPRDIPLDDIVGAELDVLIKKERFNRAEERAVEAIRRRGVTENIRKVTERLNRLSLS